MQGTRGTSPPFFIATRGHHSRKETKRKKKQHVDLRVLFFYNVRGGRHPVAPALVEVDGNEENISPSVPKSPVGHSGRAILVMSKAVM